MKYRARAGMRVAAERSSKSGIRMAAAVCLELVRLDQRASLSEPRRCQPGLIKT
jgi:hypothetical protein